MCECLEYEDGEMHLCLPCADMWREREAEKERDRKRIAELEAKLADARKLAAELLYLNPIVSGDMAIVRQWADVLRRMGKLAKEASR